MQPLVSTVNGSVAWVLEPEPGRVLGFSIVDASGYEYWYLHVNNDTPGTDDGKSRGIFAYAPDLRSGNPVVAGQLLGYLGDSGNAESTPPHLHFELHRPSGEAINPYNSLVAATHIGKAVTPPALPNEILPFGQFSGGASVAFGDVDPTVEGSELIAVAGPGGGPFVRVMKTDGQVLAQFLAFDVTDRNGPDIAAADLDNDGTDEIIIGSGPGRSPQIKVFSGTGQLISSFNPFSPVFKGGLHVAAADLDGDGFGEIVVAPRRGGGPQILVYDATGHFEHKFFAYITTFRGGIDVAALPATETAPGLIVTVPNAGGGPHLKMFDETGLLQGQFFAAAKLDRHGLMVSIADIDPFREGPEIVTVPYSGANPTARFFDLAGTTLDTAKFLEAWWEAGYDIAATTGSVVASTGLPGEVRRRTSLRPLTYSLSDEFGF